MSIRQHPAEWPQRSSLAGGIPAQRRALGTQGRERVRKLLQAGLTEFAERGFHAARVDDVTRRAQSSHGTFYLYFSSKEDLFKTLLREALDDIRIVASEFPVVTRDQAGRSALRGWVQRYGDTYAAHAPVLRLFSQAEILGEEVQCDGLQELFRLAEAIAAGMTEAAQHGGARGAELTGLACVIMLDRVNYLLSAGLILPRVEMADRLSAIIYTAFHPTQAATGDLRPPSGSTVPCANLSPDVAGRLGG